MRIVKGRGRGRVVYDLPSGSIVAKASDTDAKQYLELILSIIG